MKTCGRPPVTDLIGKRFGRLLVLGFAGSRGGRRYWQCLCDCGAVKEVQVSNLNSGGTTSCGCGRKKAPVEGDVF